jgi:acetyl-CoA carboxylase biotin carboxylase subunit
VFRRLLIANRGEIALRIHRACERMGIETVVAHSTADRDGPWLEGAAATVCVGPARSADSYLDEDAILQAAEQTECQAIHPGYGFLAENARFAARCEQQGITFVGPTSGAIRRMGDKVAAKRTMAAAGLPTIPGPCEVLGDVEEALREAGTLGYPVLLKARAGGGGRGMRRCAGEPDVRRAFDEARAEAASSFGDPGLYLEKLLEGGRHVEFQVLGDALGNGLHLGERECSIQRQHQKLVEESPSPAIDARTRGELGGLVARAVAGFGYRGAGTVEFLRTGDGRLHFMEMNTRLQVEHPVTEMLTGIDIVEQQLRVAAGERLAQRQSDVAFRGHAIEFRINAEDPARGFRPAPGTVRGFRPPPADLGGARVRWDSAVREGYRIPPQYDSLIGKLIVHADDREAALEGARVALAGLRVDGVPTTAPLYLRLIDHPEFRRGSYDVGFLERSGLLHSAAGKA